MEIEEILLLDDASERDSFVLDQIVHAIEVNSHYPIGDLQTPLESSISHISLEKIYKLKEQLYMTDAKLNSDDVKQFTRTLL
jgi:hypothetical protein